VKARAFFLGTSEAPDEGSYEVPLVLLRNAYNDLPRAACPFKRKVLGNLPWPQILKDPKSLYQSPSGASGSDSRQSFSW
jgi:hypothetical protein